jgi:vacuolar protein sorting-associated protein 26
VALAACDHHCVCARLVGLPLTDILSSTDPFDFTNVEKQYDSYNGINVKLRYFLRVSITRQYSPNITEETVLWVKNLQVGSSAVQQVNPDINNSIKMEVGIEE